jgi:PAS domain S-box-containing protein
MNPPLKILNLVVERTDAGLIERLLKKEFKKCIVRLAMNRGEFIEQLESFSPDLVLSDNTLPPFTASDALQIVRERFPLIPFILVTRAMSDEFAATILRNGADDYILKDSITHLPVTIQAALNKRKVLKELSDYKYALDQTAIVAITNVKGKIIYANDNFCRISKYSRKELIGQDHRIINSGYHPKSYIRELWRTIASGKIWRGEFRNQAKDKSFYWVDTTIIPLFDRNNKPFQYLSIRIDITENKKVKEELRLAETVLLEQQKEELQHLAAAVLHAQEKERNAIGVELHDNVNQILAGTKLFLTLMSDDPAKIKDLLPSCIEGIQEAISENRKIAHELVTPDLKSRPIRELIEQISKGMLEPAGISVTISDLDFNEDLLNAEQKITLYRIVQEHSTNIVKHANASKTNIKLDNGGSKMKLIITDNGQGMVKTGKKGGIGLSNIKSRASIFNGDVKIKTAPGKGFRLEASFPI